MPNEWFSVPDTGPPMIGTCIWCKGKSGGCDECNFTGKDELYTPVSVAEQCFQAKYLRLLRTLPGAEIGPTYEMNAARFRFDGGDGLIMPCKDEA